MACTATAVASNGLEVYLNDALIHHEYFNCDALIEL